MGFSAEAWSGAPGELGGERPLHLAEGLEGLRLLGERGRGVGKEGERGAKLEATIDADELTMCSEGSETVEVAVVVAVAEGR